MAGAVKERFGLDDRPIKREHAGDANVVNQLPEVDSIPTEQV